MNKRLCPARENALAHYAVKGDTASVFMAKERAMALVVFGAAMGGAELKFAACVQR